MGTIVTRKRYYAALLSIVLAGFAGAASADDLPSYMAPIGGRTASSAAETATKDVLALNTMMFQLYGASGAIFRKNLLDNHPIILGLFTGAGGRFILYRPGQSPLEAPPVPIKYQLMKSVGHSTMALSEVVMPFLDNASDTSWRGSLLAYRSQMQSALDDLNKADVLGDWQENSKLILANNIAFMDDCAKNGVITVAAFQAFAKKQAPLLKKNIAWAAQTQIGHWMGVIADWKKMLGSDWDKTYAASNAIYVARQNNMLFSVLAQFFGPDAINSRLVLIETISFTTTPEEMLDALTRIVADRSVGAAFFGSYYLMDYELMGGDGRAAIIDESKKRGMTPFLPPAVAFGSHQWPTAAVQPPWPICHKHDPEKSAPVFGKGHA
ncbi:MAG: hypothetical protein WBG18_02500 [Xanthobacteraceae bacterium]